jgi:alpha-D-ribose 1-methylphosphonate 5-triphosphate diphosphatase PhnM
MSSALNEIQTQLDELDRLKKARYLAVQRHYHKWYKDKQNLTDEQLEEAERKRLRRRQNAKDYYARHKERLKKEAREKYNIKVGKSSEEESSGDEIDKIGA